MENRISLYCAGNPNSPDNFFFTLCLENDSIPPYVKRKIGSKCLKYRDVDWNSRYSSNILEFVAYL